MVPPGRLHTAGQVVGRAQRLIPGCRSRRLMLGLTTRLDAQLRDGRVHLRAGLAPGERHGVRRVALFLMLRPRVAQPRSAYVLH